MQPHVVGFVRWLNACMQALKPSGYFVTASYCTSPSAQSLRPLVCRQVRTCAGHQAEWVVGTRSLFVGAPTALGAAGVAEDPVFD